MGSLSSRVLRPPGRTRAEPEPGSGAGGSARRPEAGGDAAGHGFCYCPSSRKRKRSSGALCYCHPESETEEEEEEGDEQQRLLNTPRRWGAPWGGRWGFGTTNHRRRPDAVTAPRGDPATPSRSWRLVKPWTRPAGCPTRYTFVFSEKRLRSTSKYIYQTLFLNGENSDIKICALGEEWSLHKIYLCQSGYFSSMFSGSWKESSMNIIELEIPDQNIDVEALQVAFGSLYRDDVLIKPSRVIAILAAACMLQLDGLIQQCGETMKETINVKTVCGYYTSAGTYGLDSVKKKCLEWLLNNLMTHQNVELFKELSINVMKLLIGSSNLFVMQVEMDVYTALKKWMFLQLVPSWNGSLKQLLTETDVWFSKRKKDFEGMTFLETEQGKPFVSVFRLLRLRYIISDLASARIIEQDSLIPSGWLSSVYKQQWLAMLRAEQDSEVGPQEINKEELEGNSMRCGRKLAKDGEYCWRWTGFNFGFDLLVTYTNRFIIFKRNTLNQPCSGSVSLQPRRSVAFRLRLASFDSSGKLICSRTTGYQILTLEKDQEQVVMNLDSRLLIFPLYICCNFLYISPEKRTESNHHPENTEN
ncbi:germ cell-less protein-like 1 isoform X1 [Myotis daubentonii]|uniref:germ cell-less protein-like 1 isoform X1 n=1 Tax=Myotis daubentonii TaxID=98922 RepID=UPI002873C376|nr:germ cell-less protein-like 1 isoform X1 [Myotis daubentonii]